MQQQVLPYGCAGLFDSAGGAHDATVAYPRRKLLFFITTLVLQPRSASRRAHTQEVSHLTVPYRRTLMVGTAGTEARACMYITQKDGALFKMCSGFYRR
jgi:hypothetical protein